MNIWEIIHIFEIILWFIIAGSVAYVVFFAIISLFYEKEDRIAIHAAALSNRMTKFLILYPAYKEDKVIINAVKQFLLQNYPKDLYTVIVISDHMQPETNEQLSKLPITLLQPTFEKSSKAKAMQFAIENINKEFDNVVILDADNVVRPEFLSQLNVLCSVYDAIQCHRCAKNANNDVAVLDGASEEINNTIFRKAHNRLGLSSALIGSGMCFRYQLFKENVFKLTTAGEDREMEALLLHQGIFIKYAPDIHVFDEKVSNQDNFQRQRMRWMTAQVQSLFSQLPKVPQALLHGNINFVDKTIQQALIPRSILIVLLAGISVFMTIVMPSWCEKWWILFVILAIALFIAIPKQLRSQSFSKILTIPRLVLRMLKNFLHMDRKNTDFIHTQHGLPMSNIKIFICAHKEVPLPQHPYFLPIQAGAALHELIPGYQPDNEGDNISIKNPHFCELTCHYWAWKNLKNVDIVGLNHYRRYFDFQRKWPQLSADKHFIPTKDFLQQDYQFPDLEILLKKYDIILPVARHWRVSNTQQYGDYHFAKDWEMLRQIIKEHSPQYMPAFEKTMDNSNKAVGYNMFITRWKHFDAYSEWLFNILFEVERCVPPINDPIQSRIYGYMSERLINVFCEQYNLHIKHIPLIMPLDDVILGQNINSLHATLRRVKNDLIYNIKK